MKPARKTPMSGPTQCLPGALSRLLGGQPLSDGKIRFAWRAAVGAALDRATVIQLREGTLEVTPANNYWAREVKRLRPLIVSRLQQVLGPGIVERVTVHQRDPTESGKRR